MSTENLTNLRVAVLWHDTVVTEKVVEKSLPVTIGEDLKNTLVLPDVAGIGEKHTLFEASGAGAYTLNLTGEMAGRIRHDGDETTIEQLRKSKGNSISVDGHDWGVIDLGPMAVFFQFVGESEKLPRRPFWLRWETPVLTSLLAALLAHMAFVLGAFLMWQEDPNLQSIDLSNRFVKYIIEQPPPEVEEEEEVESVDEDVGKKAGGEEGKFGEEDKKDKSKVPKVDGEMVDKIKDVGIHKALGSDLLGKGPLKNVFGDKTGFDSKLNAAMSGIGNDLVVGAGAGGMGLRGTGSGGGGEGFGRIHGMGRIDTGGGRGTRASLGGKKKKKAKAQMRTGAVAVGDFCKKSDIQRVVNARKRGVQYCYEKALQANPELQGKVTINFRVALNGSVQKVLIERSTIGNKTVESCIKRQVMRWKFPKPDGGICAIKYPFVFSAGL